MKGTSKVMPNPTNDPISEILEDFNLKLATATKREHEKEAYNTAHQAISNLLIEARIDELNSIGKNSMLEPPNFDKYKVKSTTINNRISELQQQLKDNNE